VAKPDLIILATGSELSLALAAASKLEAQDIKARVISAPCIEWFKEQPDSYQEQLIPANVRARVSIEAGIAQGWREFVGDLGEIISLEHFGASASHTKLFEEFGFTVESVVAASLRTLAKVK
jgi:transketolase